MSEFNEPWKATSDGIYGYINDAADQQIILGDDCCLDVPTATRIALCVNYCRGLSNAEIERLLLKSDHGDGI